MFYHFHGIDGQSDYGHCDIIIESESKSEAKKIAKEHLDILGHKASETYCQSAERIKGPILFSSVERR